MNPHPKYFGALKPREQQMKQRVPAAASLARLSLINMYVPLANSQILVGMRLISMGWGDYANVAASETFYPGGFLGVSAMHFFSVPLGCGFFGRLDGGVASFFPLNEKTGQAYLSDDGYDLEFSFGYSIPIGKQPKALISVDDNIAFFPLDKPTSGRVCSGLCGNVLYQAVSRTSVCARRTLLANKFRHLSSV